jgi:GntR family transcriptional regulator
VNIDWRSDAPLHVQVADLIRDAIHSGRFVSGATLPREEHFANAYNVTTAVVHRALLALRHEGLVVVRPGVAALVRAAGEHHPITLQPGDEAIARMPSPDERRRLNLDEDTPVIEIRTAGRSSAVHPVAELTLQVA